jgi:hypothetical protein
MYGDKKSFDNPPPEKKKIGVAIYYRRSCRAYKLLTSFIHICVEGFALLENPSDFRIAQEL